MFLFAFLRWLWPFGRSRHTPDVVHGYDEAVAVDSELPETTEPEPMPESSDVIYTGPDPSLPGPVLSTSELLVMAYEKAMLPRSGTVYVHFNPDGTGSVIESSDRFGPDIVIGPVKDFPLRPRPAKMASKAMLAIQDQSESLGDAIFTPRRIPQGEIERPGSLRKKRML